jgi:hypothetical protein
LIPSTTETLLISLLTPSAGQKTVPFGNIEILPGTFPGDCRLTLAPDRVNGSIQALLEGAEKDVGFGSPGVSLTLSEGCGRSFNFRNPVRLRMVGLASVSSDSLLLLLLL